MTSDTLDVFARVSRAINRRSLAWARFWIFSALFLAVRAQAQLGTGALAGRVVDVATQQPLEDVAVTAASPAAQGEQVVVTDAAGVFRIPNLPPGDYALRFERQGYHLYALSALKLRSGATLRTD